MERKKKLIDLFNNLNLYNELNRLILDYEKSILWETFALSTWPLTSQPTAICTYDQQLYICDSKQILIYKTNGMVKINFSLLRPDGIDIYEQLIYVADKDNVTILNFNLDILFSWKLPSNGLTYRSLKVDNHIVYLVIEGNQIFLCKEQDGRVLEKWGKVRSSSKDGEFNNPCGFTLNNKYLYICDSMNHRVQILNKKENGKFITKWGNGTESTEVGSFSNPYSIFYHIEEEIFYVGDQNSIQLFTKDNFCLQRIGDFTTGKEQFQFNYISGLCIVDERLFVCDSNNSIIQILSRQK